MLDHRVIEFTAQLPWRNWYADELEKGLLKRVATHYNPPKIVYGRKKGFSIPAERYFLGSWGNLLRELTQDGLVAQMGLLDPQGIARQFAEACRLRRSHDMHRR